MDIAMTSMMSKQPLSITEVSTAVLSMNLDSVKKMGDNMVKMMEQSVNPNLGQGIDIKL